jgi:hypothetical protein
LIGVGLNPAYAKFIWTPFQTCFIDWIFFT